MIRLQVNLPEDKSEELDTLMELTDIATKKELFNTALTLFEWAVKESYFNRIIASMERGSGDHKELVMPFLDRARHAGWVAGVKKEDSSAITIPFLEFVKQQQESEETEDPALEPVTDNGVLEPA